MSKLRCLSKSVATVQKYIYQIKCTQCNSCWSNKSLLHIQLQQKLLSIRGCNQFIRSFSTSRHISIPTIDRQAHTEDPEVKGWTNQITQDFNKEHEPFFFVDKTKAPTQNLENDPNLSHLQSQPKENVDQLTAQSEIEEYDYYRDEPEIPNVAPQKHIPISLQRSLSGVFNVEEIVKVLEDENGIDVRVLEIPPDIRFVDHMVIVSGKSLRHMRAMAATIEILYKKKRWNTDRQFKLEGRDCKDWFAMDLGNIVVHIFTPEARQHYDLETLWTLGPEHDDRRHYVQDENLNLTAEELFWLESDKDVQK